MPEWVTRPLLTALGFMLGFFYMRTVGLAVKLPERYTTKDDCRLTRDECRHWRDIGRTELIERFDRLEGKLDRLTEGILTRDAGRQ